MIVSCDPPGRSSGKSEPSVSETLPGVASTASDSGPSGSPIGEKLTLPRRLKLRATIDVAADAACENVRHVERDAAFGHVGRRRLEIDRDVLTADALADAERAVGDGADEPVGVVPADGDAPRHHRLVAVFRIADIGLDVALDPEVAARVRDGDVGADEGDAQLINCAMSRFAALVALIFMLKLRAGRSPDSSVISTPSRAGAANVIVGVTFVSEPRPPVPAAARTVPMTLPPVTSSKMTSASTEAVKTPSFQPISIAADEPPEDSACAWSMPWSLP